VPIVGEIMLAPAIDALPGWRAVTDLTTAIGTVPLVAVGPAGVYVVETLDADGIHTLGDVPERCLIHAWAQAKHLERRRVGGDVGALLAISGDITPSGRRRGVQVLPSAMIGPWLAARPALLSAGETNLLRARLDDAVPALVLAA
jgi:hypothetical protein